MKYAVTIEDLVPRRRELTVEIPDDMGDTDDLSEYLNRHPELWRDTHLPANHQTVTGIGPAAQPEPLADDKVIAVEWDETVTTHYRATATIGELLQELAAANDRSPEPFSDQVQMTWHLRGYATRHGLDTWLNRLHAQHRAATVSSTPDDDPVITDVRLATDNENNHHCAADPAAPGRRDSTVHFRFAEASRGHGRIELTELAEAGVWRSGTPVTEQVLEEYFDTTGADRGTITETQHTYERIAYSGPDDRGPR